MFSLNGILKKKRVGRAMGNETIYGDGLITFFALLTITFCQIRVSRKKVAAKIKEAKFSDLPKNLCLRFSSAMSIHTSRYAAKVQKQMESGNSTDEIEINF